MLRVQTMIILIVISAARAITAAAFNAVEFAAAR
jgi:hypothetical protein